MSTRTRGLSFARARALVCAAGATAASFALATSSCASSRDDGSGERAASSSAALEAVTSFGTNPGKLLMYRYVPASVPPNAPVVVLLHGCTQAATDFANAGFNALADQYKFYVVYAQQQSANNPSTCFDWFGTYNVPSDKTNLTRGRGENQSIKEMVDKMKADFSVDAARVFVAGFSAGAAFVSVMLATWPDVFAAGGIGEGIPYNCPSTQNIDVFQCMNPGKTMAASAWGTLVRNAYAGYSGARPRVSIWQGSSDTTVATANQAQLIAQWTDVHGVSGTPSAQDTVDGQAHSIFKDGNGRVVIESWSVSGMAHGFAVDPTHGCGAASQYTFDKGVCEAKRMIQFFGIDAPVSIDAGTDAAPPLDASSGDGSVVVVDAGADASSSGDAATPPDGGSSTDASSTHDSGLPLDGSTSHDSGANIDGAVASDAGNHGGGGGGGGNGAGGDAGNAPDGGGIAGCAIARARGADTRPPAFAIALAFAFALSLLARARARTRKTSRLAR